MAKTTNQAKRDWKMRRMRQNPRCFWCEVELILTEHPNPMQHNTATIDHVYHRKHPHRQNGGHGRWVLSCYWCNQMRGRLDDERYGGNIERVKSLRSSD